MLDYTGKRINPDLVFSYITHIAENTYQVKGLYEKLEKDAASGSVIANRILSVTKGLSKGQKAGFDQVISSLISEQSEALNLNYELDEDKKPTKFSFRNPIVNKDNDLGDTKRNFEKAKNNDAFKEYFNSPNRRIFIDKDIEQLDELSHYLGQLFDIEMDADIVLKMIENTKPSKTEKGLSTKEQTFYNRIFGKYASIRTFLNGKEDFSGKGVEWNNIDGFVKEWFSQLSEQSLLQRNYLNGMGNAESSIKLGHWASDLISMLKNDNETGRMTTMLESPIYKNNSVLKYFKDKKINWSKLDSVKNLVKNEVVDYSMTNANDYQILQAAKYFSNTGDGFYKQSIGVISNRDGMLLFEVPKYSISELRKEYVKQRDYLQDLLNKQMEGLDATQKKKLINDFNNLYIYKADNSGNVSIPNEQFIAKEVDKIASVLKKNEMYDALNIKDSTLKEYFLTEALNRVYLNDIFSGPALYHSSPNSSKGAVEGFIKRMSGINSNGNNIELKNPVTVVIFDGKKAGVTFSDSFGMYSKNLNKEITDFTGSFSPVGINAKNNIVQVDPTTGKQLYIKSSNVNSVGDNLKGLGDVYGRIENALNKIEEHLGENANVMLIDKSAMKGTFDYATLDLDTILDAAEKGTIGTIADKFTSPIKVDSMKTPFNLNKKLKPLDKQTAIFSTQAMLIQFNNDFSKIDKFEQVAVKYLQGKLGGKDVMNSKAVQWLLNTDNTLDDMLSGMGNREKSVTTEILIAVREHNKNNPDNKIKSFDHPSLRLIYEQHIASSLGKAGIKIDLPGNFLHQIPDLESSLEHNEVAVPYAMFANSIEEANELLIKTKEAGNELKVIDVRIPASSEVSMFAGKVKYFLDTDANVIKMSNGFVKSSGSDHDGDKAMTYRQEIDKDGIVQPFTLMSQMFNQFYSNLSSEAFVDRSVNNDLEFDVLKQWVNQKSKSIQPSTQPTDIKPEVQEIEIKDSYKSGSINDVTDIAQKMGFGGKAVGRFAIATKLMSLLSSYKAKLDPPITFRGREITHFTNENLDDVALLLQAALDIGNDPILTETGFAETTIDVGNAMILSGIKGEEVIKFLKSDAIQKLNDNFQAQNSVFNTKNKTNFKSYLKKVKTDNTDLLDFIQFSEIANDLSALISFVQLDKSLPNNAQLTDSILKSTNNFDNLSFDVSGLMNRELYKHRLKVLTAQQYVYENTLVSANPEVKKIITSLSKEVNNSFELEKKYQGQVEQYLSQKFLKKKRDNVSNFIYGLSKKMEAIYNQVVLNAETKFNSETGADIKTLYEVGLYGEEAFNEMMYNYKDLDTDKIIEELKEYSSIISIAEKSEMFKGNSFFDFLQFKDVDGKKLMSIKKDFKATDEVLSKFREDFKKIQELDPDLANDIIDYQLYRYGTNNKIGSYIEGLPMDINVMSLDLASKIIKSPSKLESLKKEIKVNLMVANKGMLMNFNSVGVLNKYSGAKKLATVNDIVYEKVKRTTKDKNGNDIITENFVKANIGKFEADNNFTAYNVEAVKTIPQSEINETKKKCNG